MVFSSFFLEVVWRDSTKAGIFNDQRDCPSGVAAHTHFERDGCAGFAVLESFDARDLERRTDRHRVVRRGVREGDQVAPPRIIGLETAGEINATF